ncbi:MAG: hypothetical protein HY820_41050 [Acidobacteria bacterium]|nr:hypothetical protein [Acidobacteriota bacterium]
MRTPRFAGIAIALLASTPALAQDGPWNHRVLLATSPDGLNWTVQPEILAERASVPELFLNPDSRPTVLFVDASGTPEGIGAMQRDPDGTWRRVTTNLREVDPNILRLSDGTYRAYVKAGLQGAMAAYSSRDGLNWTPLGEVFRDARFPNATDPDVFQTTDEWVMLVSLGPRLLRCTSKDGLQFTTDGTTFEWGGSVSDTVKVPGGWRTFFHVNADPRTGARMRIRSAFTTDGKTWQVEDGDRVVAPATGPASLGVADPAPVQLPDGSWLMAIKSFITAANPGQPAQPTAGIEAHWVGSATSEDGLRWTRDEGVRLSRASVPCAINDNDERVLLYFVEPPNQPGRPETVACAVSANGMDFERERAFQIEGLSTLKAVDPSILKDDDGRFRLYYLASNHQGDPASGPNPHAIHMALSDDGIRFRESGSVFEYPDLVDPDVFRVPATGAWLMYVFAGNRGTIISRSTDGQQFQFEGTMSPPGWGTTAPVTLPDGRLRLYAFDQRTPIGNAVRSFLSEDGINWTQEAGDRIAANPDEQITDPFVIPWRGGWKMYFKITPARRQFITGQPADLVLGAKGFNDSGGAGLFNHPTGLATDGKALLMADRWNNRVLIWKVAPSSNTPPDLVLGQLNFTTNNSGSGRNQLNWPGNVAITPDGRRIAVTDTNNDRVLIWNEFPNRSGAPADVIIDLTRLSQPGPTPGGMRFGWPWGVWTDGRKFAIVATQGAAVLIWNSIPTRDNLPPDLILRPRAAGTPRNITSDGETFFAVSDHNNGEERRPGTMVWLEVPSTPDQPPAFTWPEWFKGTFTSDGKLILAGIQSVSIYNRKPTTADTRPDLVLRPSSYRNGDGPDAVTVQGRLYVCNYNGNNVLVWNSVPTANQQPDFALGSDRPDQDTWAENFFIQNPALATDGKSLFASSDFDRKLFIWRTLPTESTVRPDVIMNLQEGPWDNAVHGTRLALAGRSTVYLWNTLPLNGERPNLTLTGNIGGVQLRELTGVAMDTRYFYLADRQANRIYVWDGVPSPQTAPRHILEMENPGRMSSDGVYLAVAPFEGQDVMLWQVENIGRNNQPIRIGGRGVFNLPGDALAVNGMFFVADRSNNRVQVWNRVQDAIVGKPADAFLGANNPQDLRAGLGPTKLFMPGALAFDGNNLWVGEFKFSTRILRFSPQVGRLGQPNP